MDFEFRVRVVPRGTVVGGIDRRFGNLSGSHHQSHVNCVWSVNSWYLCLWSVVPRCSHRLYRTFVKSTLAIRKGINGFRECMQYPAVCKTVILLPLCP